MRKEIKEGVLYFLGVVIVLGIIVSIFLAARWFNMEYIKFQVHSPKPGVECLVVTSTDGAAVDCWQVKE